QKAFELLMQGADTLDAVIEGVKIQELDPNDDSVGYGGLPNADGVVQLDASCMHGPSKRAGAVGALEGIKTPSEVAKLVLKYTDNEVGAAGSTGRGESNIKVCGGFLTVEFMRRGMKPTDACLETLKRVVQLSETRLLGADGKPKFSLNFYAVNKRGEFGAASLYPSRYAAHDGTEAKLRDTAFLYERPAASR